MRSFPLPVRVAAGLAVSAAEWGRHLPNYLLGLPVTVVSQALQASMRVQQQVTELAIKGDTVLTGWQTTAEEPDWATFDEDDETPERPAEQRAPERPAEQGTVLEATPDYDELSLAQLRGRLRRFSASELLEILDYERANANRPEFVRMLGNRLDKLRAEENRD